MGNCSLKGVTGECHYSVRVLSDWGSLLQFKGPITVGEVLRHQPGYGIFRQGRTSSPLQEHESLSYGLLYYLLPLKPEEVVENSSTDDHGRDSDQKVERSEEAGWRNGKKLEKLDKSQPAGEKESDYVKNLSNGSAVEVLPSAGNGIWKVKLVIDTKQLEEILSEQVNTEALIEKMRMAASATSASPARSKRTMSTWKLGWSQVCSIIQQPLVRRRVSATQSCPHKSTL